MTDPTPLPPLGDWKSTRDTLQRYAKVLGNIRRELNGPHPRWWHISLQPTERGLTTGPLGDPPRTLALELDLHSHRAALLDDGTPVVSRELGTLTATALGDDLLSALADAGLAASPDPGRWQSDAPPHYDAEEASAYLAALSAVNEVFTAVQSELPGERSPVQLWPHHFDLSFEWFSDRMVSHEENGETHESPAQIGYGFSTGDEGHPSAYFYANPWEFDAAVVEHELPGSSCWHTESWQGALFPYAEVSDTAELASYLRRVFEVAEPTLR